MKNKNIVLFSSGISESNGILVTIGNALSNKGYNCAYWRDLFNGANNSNNIALLPMLLKKIPTFDYAILICEGHDTTMFNRNGSCEQVKTMRDNVLFEIGLCAMALGLPRTIIVADEDVRMPDDLMGVNNTLAIKRVVYQKRQVKSYISAATEISNYMQTLDDTATEIDKYIKETGNVLTPVVIGAASSTACGYVNNFIFRTLEHIDEGIEVDNKIVPVDISKVYMHIILPEKYTDETAFASRNIIKNYRKGVVNNARNRPANFFFEQKNDEIHIIDYPTTIGTSYETAKMILGMDADDKEDAKAAERFIQKELNLFESTVKILLEEGFLDQVIANNYLHMTKDEQTQMKNKVLDVITNRFSIKYMEY